jgi:transcriptional regulator with XRE-family HTH domain
MAKKYKQTEEKIYPESKNSLLEQLETYRLENKITQEDLAKELDVAFSTVNRWFNKKSKPNKIQKYHIEKLIKKG